MSSIPFAVRVGARYHFRRRLHLRNIISRPVGLSLRTSDPAEARIRSALLSAKFAVVKRRLTALFSKNRDFLTGPEIAALMRAELENELARAIAPSFDDCDHVSAIAYSSRYVAEAYSIAGRSDRPKTIHPEDEAKLVAKGLDVLEVDFVRQDVEDTCQNDELSDEDVTLRLEAVGAPVNAGTLERARTVMMRARSEAYHRATRMLDPQVTTSADPVTPERSDREGGAGCDGHPSGDRG